MENALAEEEGVDPEDEFQRAAPLRKQRLFAYDWAKGFVSPYRPADVTPPPRKAAFGSASADIAWAQKEEVVHSVLELVRPKEEDVVFDLGSGDGRFLLAFAAAIREAAIAPATTKQGSVVVGYELDAALASLSRDHATAAGLAHLVEVREEGNARTFSFAFVLLSASSLCPSSGVQH